MNNFGEKYKPLLNKKALWNILEIPFILCFSLLISKYFILLYWRKNIFVAHEILEFACIFISLGIFFIYWLSEYKNKYVNDFVALGFLSVSIFNTFHIISFNSFKYHSINFLDLSIVYSNFGTILETFIFLILALNIKVEIKKKWTALYVIIIVSLVFSYIINNTYEYIPQMVSTNSSITLAKFIVGTLEVGLCIFAGFYIKKSFISNKIISYNYLFKGIIFEIFSTFSFLPFINVFSLAYFWGHVLKFISYCFIFKGIFGSLVIYPYNEIENLYNESEERFKSAFDKLTSGVIITDLKGKIIKANEQAIKIIGFSNKEYVDFDINTILPKDKIALNLECLVSILRNYEDKILAYGINYSIDSDVCTWLRINVSITKDIIKNPLYILFELHDDFQKQRIVELESDIEQKGKLLEDTIKTDKLRIEFFSNLSHELRTPLNVISGSVQLLEMYLKGNINENISRNINYMKQNCRRLLRLVNNLLDTSKIEAGFYKLNLRKVNIISLVEDISQSVTEYINSRGLQLIFDTDTEEKMIYCDPDKIERIMLNLLSNAIKFTSKGGKIYVYMSDMGDKILISVKDTGIGIPVDKQKLVFERFSQANKSLIKNSEGSGIGLALIKSFIDLHNGSIQLVSEVGIGSEFIITLPGNLNASVDDEEFIYDYTERVERIRVEFSDIYTSE